MDLSASEVKVYVRLPRGVRDQVAEMAEKDRRSLNREIVVILERAIKDYLDASKAGDTTETA
jgi:hypothetical protein